MFEIFCPSKEVPFRPWLNAVSLEVSMNNWSACNIHTIPRYKVHLAFLLFKYSPDTGIPLYPSPRASSGPPDDYRT